MKEVLVGIGSGIHSVIKNVMNQVQLSSRVHVNRWILFCSVIFHECIHHCESAETKQTQLRSQHVATLTIQMVRGSSPGPCQWNLLVMRSHSCKSALCAHLSFHCTGLWVTASFFLLTLAQCFFTPFICFSIFLCSYFFVVVVLSHMKMW